MNGIRLFFTEIKNNKKYMIPVFLFTISSLMYLFTYFNILWATFALLFQMIFIVWILIVALLNKFKIWPILIFGFLLLCIGLSMVNLDTESLEEAKLAYSSNDYNTSKSILESIDSEEIIKTQEYVDLLNNVNSKIIQQSKEFIEKAKKAIKDHKIDEAKNTLEVVLNQDINNKEASELNKIIDKIQEQENEKLIAAENKAKIKKLEEETHSFLKNNKFVEARENIENFLNENSNIMKDNHNIKKLSNKIDAVEKQAEITKKNALIYSKLVEAKEFFNKKKYEKSISRLEEILEIDQSHKESKNLLIKSKKNLKIENDKFWSNVKGIGILILVIIFGIGYAMNNTEANDSEKPSKQKNNSLFSELLSDQKHTCNVTFKYIFKGNKGQRNAGYRVHKSESAVIAEIKRRNPDLQNIEIISIKWKD